MSNIPDYMKILKNEDTTQGETEPFVSVKEYYHGDNNNDNDDNDDKNDNGNSCLNGHYSRRNVLFIFVAIAILVCVIYILLNKDIP